MQKNKLIRSICLGEWYYAEEVIVYVSGIMQKNKLTRSICLGEWYYAEE